MNKEIKYGLVGLLIGGFVVWGIMTMSGNTPTSGMMGVNTKNSINNSNILDAHFIEQMIPHHEDAITMAKLAQTKAQHPEIKQLAENIIDSQSKEISQMKSWYEVWFDKKVPSGTQVMGEHGMMGGNGMHMGMMGNQSDMTRLEKEADFDKAFIEEMIPHHQMAVMMANMLLRSTDRPEMKKLAQDIITAQTKEINEMRQWYQTWGYAQ